MAQAPTRLLRPCSARAFGVLWVWAVLVAGCNKPTSENITLWKTTEKGPGRLHETLADHGVTPRLRAEAAVALVDIGKSDEVDSTLSQLPIEDRAELTKSLMPLYEVAMKDPAPERALVYRDALYSLRQYAAPDDQKHIDATLLPVIETDLRAGRLRQGRHSLDKMLTAIGPDAGEMLARVLSEPAAPVPQAAELLGKVGDEPARDKGAKAVIARLSKAKSADKGAERSGERDSLIKALGAIGGPAAVKLLEERAGGSSKEEAVTAVRALEQRRDPSVLPFALKVASDTHADKLVRDEMFGVIETIGGLEAQKGLLGIISSDREEIVRYRAFESVLTVAKADGIVPGLEAFPAAAAYKKVDVDDLLVKLIEKLGASARPALVKALDSRSPLARMTAVMSLEQIGRAPDAAALQKLSDDSTQVKGFPAGQTIGKEAARVAETVKKKA
jgi:HEAT repeat protein